MGSGLGIRGKIVGGFGVVLVLLAGAAGGLVWIATSYGAFVERVGEREISAMIELGEVRSHLNASIRYAWQAVGENDSVELSQSVEAMQSNLVEGRKHLTTFEAASGAAANLTTRFDAVAADFETFREQLGSPTGHQKAHALLQEKLAPGVDVFAKSLDGVVEGHEREIGERVHAARNGASLARLLAGIFVVLGLLFAIFGVRIFVSALVGRLRGMASALRRLAEAMREASARNGTESEKLSASATETSASLEEVSSTVDMLGRTAEQNALHARKASDLVNEAGQTAEDGAEEVAKLVAAMSDLSESSKKIEEIIAVIDGIAFQTNLLALNAAVEAARAGEQGKGFAVVAEAVRSLAQKSSSSAKEISALIQETVEKTTRGAKVAAGSGEILRTIVQKVTSVTGVVNEIAAASNEQAGSITQVAQALQQLGIANRAHSSGAEEFSAMSVQAARQADELWEKVALLERIVGGNDTIATHPVVEKPAPSEGRVMEKTREPEPRPIPEKKKASPSKKAVHEKPEPAKRVVERPAIAATVGRSPEKKTPASSLDPEAIIPFESDEPGESGAADGKIGSIKGF